MTTHLAQLWTLALCIGLGTAPSPAQALESTEVPGYRAAIDEALAEYELGGYLEARTLFARAHELYPNARTLRGLGLVSFELRRYAESAAFLEQALASKEKPIEGTMRDGVEQLLARARGFVATIEVALEPSDAAISVDGAKAVLQQGATLLLDGGKHELEFEAPGFLSEHRAYTVVGGERLQWNISLRSTGMHGDPSQRSEDGGPTADLVPATPESRFRRAKVISMSMTAAALATTGVAVGMRERRARELQHSCSGNSERCSDLQANGKAWRAGAISAGALTSALLVTTLALFAVDHSRERATPLQRALRACGLGDRITSVSCQGQF
ncbi:MAG: hypothetical protein JWN48_4147 [Myxococcaceae bacterium]|nr:hypothetical protein [Myxococcaceae bacterium]